MKYLISLLAFVSGLVLQAQTIWTEPSLPTADSPLTVYFDATGTALEGYDGNVYTHTGVNLTDNNWQYVIGSWGDNNTQPQLVSEGNDLYSLEITPDVYSFYAVPETESITGLAFVFRGAEGSPQTADLFIDIYATGLAVSFVKPAAPLLVPENDSIDVEIQANQADSVLLEINGHIVSKVAGNSLTYSFEAQNENPINWMVAIARDGQVEARDSTYYIIRPEVNIAEMPPGMHKGANYLDDETVTLVLQAPGKSFVYALGDFNNWDINNDYFMNLDPDGEHFWITIGQLIPGKPYIYQYFIDGEIKVADPYTEQTSDINDKYISPTIYPGLIAYPDGKADGVASVFETAQKPFDWQDENFTPPKQEDLVIYELLIRDFADENSYATIRDTLDYLKNMGVNALELMPVSEFEGNSSWGYNPSFYFAPDKAYGPKEELKSLIDAAHQKGMAVFMDLVLNHSYDQSPLVKMYSVGGNPTDDNPWYNAECPHEPYCWGNDFNHESIYTQAFVDSVNAYWIQYYHIDGFRFDYTKGFTNNGNLNYDPDRINLLKRMADEIRAVDEDTYVILEHWADNNEEKQLVDYGMMVWGNVTYAYNEAVMGWHEDGKSDLSWASYKERGWDEPGVVIYMESHDEERLMYKAMQWGNQQNPEYDVRDLTIALERGGTAAVFLFAIPGPKMIWQFGELGYDYSIEYDCRICPKPVRWDYFDDYRRRFLYDVYGALADLKTRYDVFETDDFDLDVEGALKKVVLRGLDMDAVVLGNFDVNAGEIIPSFTKTGTWYEYITGSTLEVAGVDDPITLQPGEYRIYTSEEIQPANLNVGFLELAQDAGQPLVYPNPSSSDFHINLELNASGWVNVVVYNSRGQMVEAVANEQLDSGSYRFTWQPAPNLKKGIYFIRIVNEGHSHIEKVLYQ
jgi:glycosidase